MESIQEHTWTGDQFSTNTKGQQGEPSPQGCNPSRFSVQLGKNPGECLVYQVGQKTWLKCIPEGLGLDSPGFESLNYRMLNMFVVFFAVIGNQRKTLRHRDNTDTPHRH